MRGQPMIVDTRMNHNQKLISKVKVLVGTEGGVSGLVAQAATDHDIPALEALYETLGVYLAAEKRG